MEPSEYRTIAENEDSHFYYVGNRAIIISLIQHYLKERRRLHILDAGCGTGHLTQELAQFGKVDALDVSPVAVALAKKAGIPARVGSINHLPYRANTFDLVVSLDVLYHQRVNDVKALAECFRVLAPGGLLILRVPAHPYFSTSHDRVVHTRERYTKERLRKKLLAAGFAIEKLTYVNAILLPLALAVKVKEFLFPPKAIGSGVQPLPPLVNRLLAACLTMEADLLPRLNLPLGNGLLALAGKPPAP